MANPPQDSLLREIDEDLRHERYAQLWQRYGALVIAAAVALVVAVAGYEGWKAWQQSQRAEAAERFSGAITLAETDPEAAIGVFDSLATDAPHGYEILSRLRAAEIHVDQGNIDAAIAEYEALAGATEDALYHDMAVVLRSMAAMKTSIAPPDAERLLAELEPATAPGRPLRHTAQELAALLALQIGDRDQARSVLNDLVTDVQTPSGVRARAEQLLADIGPGGDA